MSLLITNFEKLVRFDSIRIHKLMEIIQYSVITFFLGILLGGYVNKLFPKADPLKNTSRIILELVLQVSFITISLYYFQKLMSLIPFMFHFDSTYIPSHKNEGIKGAMIGLGLVFAASQIELKNKINILMTKIY
jgi:hypothetical protein